MVLCKDHTLTEEKEDNIFMALTHNFPRQNYDFTKQKRTGQSFRSHYGTVKGHATTKSFCFILLLCTDIFTNFYKILSNFTNLQEN